MKGSAKMSNKGNGSTLIVALLLGALIFTSCKDKNSPGYEYMPDMYRSPALEAYVDYGQDPYYFGEELAQSQRLQEGVMASRKPVEGTIPFSMTGEGAYNYPYPYPNTNAGYEASAALKSPIAMTEETVEKGKAHYTVFCRHCHGDKGAGDGPVVEKGGYAVPGAYAGALVDLPEGKMFHSLMFGKGQGMGSHASQLSRKERWEVIQYVKFLQNGEKMTRGAEVTTDNPEGNENG